MLIQRLATVAPIKDIYLEVGSFDTQLLDAIAKGLPIQEGTDYQQGALYGEETLRKAVFQRDNYTCQVCGRTIKDGAKLHTHHFLYWKGRHGNRLDELCTVCEKCHTSANHQKGGKLYGWGADKKFKSYVSAAFMNTVRWYIVNQVKDLVSDTEVHTTYGAATKLARKDFQFEKSHVNDAYAMGKLHPNIRCETEYYKKVRRNNRCLEKFYDAKYIDIRDGKKKSGKELGVLTVGSQGCQKRIYGYITARKYLKAGVPSGNSDIVSDREMQFYLTVRNTYLKAVAVMGRKFFQIQVNLYQLKKFKSSVIQVVGLI